ncbi:polysaccharide deacetylase family protein [Puia sp. P3]|uniref:polysaccharide deacetylase family protein n=1 Tax=Puia sp. P3 TaxID=3423952 RepID=UPI003D67B9F6
MAGKCGVCGFLIWGLAGILAGNGVVAQGVAGPSLMIYLTSDDGPEAGSEQLVRVVDSLKIRCNVFVVGSRVFRDSNAVGVFMRLIHDSLFLTGNHSWTHASGHYRKYYDSAGSRARRFQEK